MKTLLYMLSMCVLLGCAKRSPVPPYNPTVEKEVAAERIPQWQGAGWYVIEFSAKVGNDAGHRPVILENIFSQYFKTQEQWDNAELGIRVTETDANGYVVCRFTYSDGVKYTEKENCVCSAEYKMASTY